MTKKLLVVLLVVVLTLLALVPVTAQDEFVFGMILVGDKGDQGWNQAHLEGGEYVEEHIEGARMLLFEKLNPADNPETSVLDVIENMVDEGAQLIYTTSAEFEPQTLEAAEMYPDVTFIHASGSGTLGMTPADVFPDMEAEGEAAEAPANFGNIMGKMEYGKLIAGCAAGLATETGQLGYLGPLIDPETRRLTASAYLGARYCYENYAGGNPDDLSFEVIWIGFWFNIPGVTLDPTQVVNTFYDGGVDVVLSGIDTPEATIVSGQRAEQGDPAFAVPYDFIDGCAPAEDVCLGVPYFNWGPSYLSVAESVVDGSFESNWWWLGPDWEDINNLETSTVGWVSGPALSDEDAESLDAFIEEARAFATDPMHEGEIFLWEGPLNLQDGTVLAEEDEAVNEIAVWYLPQLLEGMTGDSVAAE